MPLGEQVDHLTYSTSSDTYVLGTSHKADFRLPEDDELHPEWRNEGRSGKSRLLGTRSDSSLSDSFPSADLPKLGETPEPEELVCHRQVWYRLSRTECI